MTRGKLWTIAILILAAAVWFFCLRGYPIVNAPPRSGPIVAFGDSLTAGVGASAGQTYPEQLARLIGRPVVAAGVPGETVADAMRRLDRDVLARRPGVVIVLLGGNDVLRRNNLDQSFADLEAMVRRIQSSGAMVVLVGIRVFSPVGGIGGRYADLARKTGCVFVPHVLKGISSRGKFLADPIHPNSAGYAIMAERIAKALTPYLAD